jgi:hypothetical protein
MAMGPPPAHHGQAMKRMPKDAARPPDAATHAPATGGAAMAPDQQGAWVRQLHSSPRMLAQRRLIEASFGALTAAPVQRMMGFEFQVRNQHFYRTDLEPESKGEDRKSSDLVKPDNKEEIGRLGPNISIERDGSNPEFVTDPFSEKLDPGQVGDAVSAIATDYDAALRVIESGGKAPRVRAGTRPPTPQIDVQSTGGFSLAEIAGWLTTLAGELHKGGGSPYREKEGNKRYTLNARRLEEGLATRTRHVPSWQSGLPKRLLENLQPSVAGLMLLAQTNIQAVTAARDDTKALGVKTLTAVLPKTNLSSLYEGMTQGDKLHFAEIAAAIEGNGGHPWRTPIPMNIPDTSNRLQWEYVKRWEFKPYLYPQDIINGVEPMWVFEGFSEIGGGEDRPALYEEFEETHGESRKFSGDRDKVNAKWAKTGVDPTKEAILEMRDFGSDKMQLSEIAKWAADAFTIYKLHKAKTSL